MITISIDTLMARQSPVIELKVVVDGLTYPPTSPEHKAVMAVLSDRLEGTSDACDLIRARAAALSTRDTSYADAVRKTADLLDWAQALPLNTVIHFDLPDET